MGRKQGESVTHTEQRGRTKVTRTATQTELHGHNVREVKRRGGKVVSDTTTYARRGSLEGGAKGSFWHWLNN